MGGEAKSRLIMRDQTGGTEGNWAVTHFEAGLADQVQGGGNQSRAGGPPNTICDCICHLVWTWYKETGHITLGLIS